MLRLYENIKALRLERNWTQDELARRAGYTDRSSIAKIEKGQVDLTQSKILTFANVFNVAPGDLMGDDGVEDIVERYENLRQLTRRRFPVLGSVSCGEPILMSEDKEVEVSADDDIRADFVLIASGDSMIGAKINDGDLVFVRRQPTVENGQIAVVAIDDEATLKRFYRYDGLIVLRAENPAYADIEIRPEDGKNVLILGRAVRVQSELR